MKAITIWQPWASLLACGGKRFETRSWATSYRGPIAIHAAKKSVFHVLDLIPSPVLAEMTKRIRAGWKDLPTGAVIATAELVNVWHIVHRPGRNVDKAKYIPVGAESMTTDKHDPAFGDYFVPSEMELAFGDWTPGRYAWEIANVKMITPVSIKGRQGLWEWRDEQE